MPAMGHSKENARVDSARDTVTVLFTLPTHGGDLPSVHRQVTG